MSGRRPTAEEIRVFDADALSVTPSDYREIVLRLLNPALRARIEASRPVVPQRSPVRSVEWAHGVRAEGKRGQTVKICEQLNFVFRPSLLRATDSSATLGRATRVTLRVGQEVAFTLIPTWLFWESLTPEEIEVCRDAQLLLGTADETESARRQAALPLQEFTVRNLRWATWLVGQPVEIEVHFDEDCRWDGVFVGKTIR